MAAERASIFSDDKELDISGFKPKPPGKPVGAPVPVEQVRAVSEAAQFRSRDPKPPRKSPRAASSAGIAPAATFS